MKTCPVCGFHNTDLETECVKCNGALAGPGKVEAAEFVRKRSERLNAPSRFRGPGFLAIWGRAAIRLQRLFGLLKPGIPLGVPDRIPYTAAVLSLVPGVGQLYNHQPMKALYFALGWAAFVAAAWITIRETYSNWILGAFVLWAIYAFHDGFKTAVRINQGYWSLARSLGFYAAWVFLLCAACLTAQFLLGFWALKLMSVQQVALAPRLMPSDRIAVDRLSYLFRKPKLGEIVLYWPERVQLEIPDEVGNDLYMIRRRLGIERVLALPGQTFERRGDLYFRDGVEIDADEGPIARSEVTWDYSFTVPEDHYLILFSYTGDEKLSIRGVNFQAPPLSAGIVHGWEAACLVPKSKILGRAWFIYHPPPRRGRGALSPSGSARQ